MNEYTKNQIINTSRHQFLYGYNTEERTKFLKEIARDYPITFNRNRPQAIYMEDLSLPIIESDYKVDRSLLEIASRDYFDFSIYYQLLDELLKQNYDKELNGREERFFKWVNCFLLNQDFRKIENLTSLKEAFLKAKNYYRQYYISLLTDTDLVMDYRNLPISDVFLQEGYMKEFKKLVNNSSYFALIIDQKEKMPIVLQEAVNWLVTKRNTSYISMKVACNPNEWLTYYDIVGNLAEYPHDYTYIELDSSQKDRMEQKKKDFYKKYPI